MSKIRYSRKWLVTFSLLVTTNSVVIAQSQNTVHQEQESQKPYKDASLFMQAKLANSQKVLAGLVSEDFESITAGAKQMKRIAEAAHWPKTIDEVYQHFSFEFRRQCDKLVEHSAKRDLRAAHFSYLALSTSCIDCHEHVRLSFKVERNRNGPIRLIPNEWDGPTRKLPRPSPDNEDRDTKLRTTTNLGEILTFAK